MIIIRPGELTRICDAAEEELAKTGSYYQQKGIMATINIHTDRQNTVVQCATLSDLTLSLANLVIWQRYDHRSKKSLVCDPSEKCISLLLDKGTYSYLPVLNGISRQPYFRSNGGLVMADGYDPETGMFGVFNPTQFTVPETPTHQQAEEALAKLLGLLSEFEFITEHDKAAALSSILTAAVRPSLAYTPMIHVKAPTMSCGKSYLCELLTAFATSEKGTPHAFPIKDEECRKLLLSILLTSPAVVEFDNMTSDLIPHNSLCTALTSEFIAGRILGKSKTSEVGTRVLFLSSGNNVDPVGDMARRTLTINLDPKCETPATRTFSKQPVNEVRADRGRYVTAALTIVRAYQHAGKLLTACKPIAGYEDWSNYCRQPLLWLGLPDPASSMFESMNEDPDRGLRGEFLQAFHAEFGKISTTVKEIVKTNNHVLRELIIDISAERDGGINSKKLGRWIKRHAGHCIKIDGIQKRFVRDTSVTYNVARWIIEVIE